VKILAHRGASADAPENTLTAFAEAARQKADGVELDVMLCQSGEMVVCHDEKLDRLARVPWVVQATPYWKLSKADVGTPLGFAPERIPRLEEVFEALAKDLVVNVELKCETVDDGGLTRRVAQYLTGASLQERVVVSSFNPFCLLRLAQGWPSLRRGYLIDPEKSWLWHSAVVAPLVSRFSVHPPQQQVTPERVERWHARGWKVAAWTVDEGADADAMERAGVDYLITNRPMAIRNRARASY
jgi:glycerophosphoryl diester phosphodiesterase